MASGARIPQCLVIDLGPPVTATGHSGRTGTGSYAESTPHTTSLTVALPSGLVTVPLDLLDYVELSRLNSFMTVMVVGATEHTAPRHIRALSGA